MNKEARYIKNKVSNFDIDPKNRNPSIKNTEKPPKCFVIISCDDANTLINKMTESIQSISGNDSNSIEQIKKFVNQSIEKFKTGFEEAAAIKDTTVKNYAAYLQSALKTINTDINTKLKNQINQKHASKPPTIGANIPVNILIHDYEQRFGATITSIDMNNKTVQIDLKDLKDLNGKLLQWKKVNIAEICIEGEEEKYCVQKEEQKEEQKGGTANYNISYQDGKHYKYVCE